MNRPCTSPASICHTPRRRAARGIAKLEFALVVAATAVVAALALERIAGLQALGREVQHQTAAAQQRAASALALTRCPVPPSSPTSGATSACP